MPGFKLCVSCTEPTGLNSSPSIKEATIAIHRCTTIISSHPRTTPPDPMPAYCITGAVAGLSSNLFSSSPIRDASVTTTWPRFLDLGGLQGFRCQNAYHLNVPVQHILECDLLRVF